MEKPKKKLNWKIFLLIFLVLTIAIISIKNYSDDREGLGEQGQEYIPIVEVNESSIPGVDQVLNGSMTSLILTMIPIMIMGIVFFGFLIFLLGVVD